ncbi:hypothetical protein CRG98_031573 [Punica granatum]|uniref:RNase H type-1 domain-containing protein n=1 Tax=Punica granatum TaxID=22663 RepID=A0A2I0IXD8_PUNGR|nr:hypothetical protein CRG98_031573 [Punica granatum]
MEAALTQGCHNCAGYSADAIRVSISKFNQRVYPKPSFGYVGLGIWLDDAMFQLYIYLNSSFDGPDVTLDMRRTFINYSAIKMGLAMAWDLDLRKLILETHSEVVVQLIQGSQDQAGRNEAVIRDVGVLRQ